MPTSSTRIDEPQIERDARGKITAVRFAFGPHHFVEVWVEDGKTRCAIGTTHHGILIFRSGGLAARNHRSALAIGLRCFLEHPPRHVGA